MPSSHFLFLFGFARCPVRNAPLEPEHLQSIPGLMRLDYLAFGCKFIVSLFRWVVNLLTLNERGLIPKK